MPRHCKCPWRILSEGAELELQTCQAFQGRQIEAINFGVAGYGTAQELTLRHRVGTIRLTLCLAFVSEMTFVITCVPLSKTPGGRISSIRYALVLDASFKRLSVGVSDSRS
jgi:hypothetical protein